MLFGTGSMGISIQVRFEWGSRPLTANTHTQAPSMRFIMHLGLIVTLITCQSYYWDMVSLRVLTRKAMLGHKPLKKKEKWAKDLFSPVANNPVAMIGGNSPIRLPVKPGIAIRRFIDSVDPPNQPKNGTKGGLNQPPYHFFLTLYHQSSLSSRFTPLMALLLPRQRHSLLH